MRATEGECIRGVRSLRCQHQPQCPRAAQASCSPWASSGNMVGAEQQPDQIASQSTSWRTHR